jgi:putative ABC transport system permease protein
VSIIWCKVWRDLWQHKLRTLLVVLATAVGVFALGFVFGSSGVMREQMTRSHQDSVPPHIELYTSYFHDDAVYAVEREPGVAVAEAQLNASLRWRREGATDWEDGILFARPDYDAQIMYPIERWQGGWPGEREVAVERMSEAYYHLPVGTRLEVEIGRQVRTIEVTGIVRHPYTPPPQIGMGQATFIASPETAAWLNGMPEGFNTLNVRIDSFSEEAARATAERIKDRLQRMGIEVGYWDVVDPEVHWGQDMIDAVFLILTVLGALSLGLSGFLIINVMNATITQQVWQIGVMKVVGATSGLVIRIYLVTAAVYGLLALLIAVPLGAVTAHAMSIYMLDLFNIVVRDFRIIPWAIALQAAMGLAVPVAAAAVPVIGGARITPHQAISTHGLGGRFGRGWFDRLLGRIRCLPRLLALSLRNTFRRKGRVTLTVLALMLGGVMFIMVLSVSASFRNTLEVLLSDFGFDVLIIFSRSYHIERLVEATESVPGVERAEVWTRPDAQLALPGGEEMDVGVWGVPAHSTMFSPRIAAGRDLLPDDERAILLNNKIAEDEGFQVGDAITLTIGGRETSWTVVGLVININNNFHDNFAPFDALSRAMAEGNHGSLVMVRAASPASPGPEGQAADLAALSNALRSAYQARRIEAAYLETADQVRQEGMSSFNVVTYLMLAMSALAALVGGIGLASTMAINVIERGREIGVMRAIGGTSLAIVGVFLVEGLLVGLLSGLFAIPLSYPGARLFSHMVGQTLVELPLDFRYPPEAVLLWLLIVAVLSTLASVWPALRATRISVRESLAYE